MQENNQIRGLTAQERKNMKLIYQITSYRRQIMAKVEVSMHQEFDKILQDIDHSCCFCNLQFKGKQIGAHYRNSPKCKYMKDRPWLKKLPANWQQDLKNSDKTDISDHIYYLDIYFDFSINNK